MPRYVDNEFRFGGLNTKAQSTGLPVMDSVVLQDLRVVGTDLVERLGIVRVAQVAGDGGALDFASGSTESCSGLVDPRVWTLGLNWTFEVVVEPDTVAGTQGVICAGHTTPSMILDITGGNYRLRVWDSAATLTTVTVGTATASLQTIQATRDGATVSTRLDNGTAVTGSMSATLLGRTPAGDLRIANDDAGNVYDGTIDNPRLYAITKANHNDRLIRNPAPRASFVLADYDLKNRSGPLVYDRSRYGNHLVANNTPTDITVLTHNPAPIRCISMSLDQVTNRKQLLVAAGGAYYLCDCD